MQDEQWRVLIILCMDAWLYLYAIYLSFFYLAFQSTIRWIFNLWKCFTLRYTRVRMHAKVYKTHNKGLSKECRVDTQSEVGLHFYQFKTNCQMCLTGNESYWDLWGHRWSEQTTVWFPSMAQVYTSQVWANTFALQALAEQTLKQLLAVLADSGTCVGVDDKRVRHLDFGQQDLVKLDRAPDVGLRVGAPSSREHVLLLKSHHIEMGQKISLQKTHALLVHFCSLSMEEISKHTARLITFMVDWSVDCTFFFFHHEHSKVGCVKLHPEHTPKTSLAL